MWQAGPQLNEASPQFGLPRGRGRSREPIGPAETEDRVPTYLEECSRILIDRNALRQSRRLDVILECRIDVRNEFRHRSPRYRPRSLPRTIPHAPSWRYRRGCRETLVLARSVRLLRYEAITDARDRMNVVRLLGVALDLLAQPVNVSIDRAGLDLDLVAPDFAQQLATAHHLAGLRG